MDEFGLFGSKCHCDRQERTLQGGRMSDPITADQAIDLNTSRGKTHNNANLFVSTLAGIITSTTTSGIVPPAAASVSTSLLLNRRAPAVIRPGYRVIQRVYSHENGHHKSVEYDIVDQDGNLIERTSQDATCE